MFDDHVVVLRAQVRACTCWGEVERSFSMVTVFKSHRPQGILFDFIMNIALISCINTFQVFDVWGGLGHPNMGRFGIAISDIVCVPRAYDF